MSTDHKPFNGHTELPWKQPDGNALVIQSDADMTVVARMVGYEEQPSAVADAEFILHACNTYYTREAELSSLRASLKMCVEALDVAMKSLATYGPHPLIELQANNVNAHVKASHPNL